MAEAIFQTVGYVVAFGAFVMLAIDRERLSRKLRRMRVVSQFESISYHTNH